MSEHNHLYTLNAGAALVVVGDTRNAFSSIDDALINGARLMGSIIETAQKSDLPAGITQKLYASMAKSVNTILSGRSDMLTALALMERIRDRSNIRETADGCAYPWPEKVFMPMGKLDKQATV